jgi:hypothetical protein
LWTKRANSALVTVCRSIQKPPTLTWWAGAEALAEVGEVLGRGVVGQLRLLLGVQVVQVAEELVEAVVAGQVLVLVAQVVLAELAGRVPQRLEQLGDGRVLGPQPQVAPGSPTLLSPVRNSLGPVMNADRPAVQLCSP